MKKIKNIKNNKYYRNEIVLPAIIEKLKQEVKNKKKNFRYTDENSVVAILDIEGKY